MSKESTQKALSELKELVHKAKRRIKYSQAFESEVRTIINRLNIITKQSIDLTSLNKNLYPREIPRGWYKEKGKNYFEDPDFDTDDDYYTDDEEFERFIVQELKDNVKRCEDIVTNSLYELKQIDKPKKEPVKHTSKPKVVPERKIIPKNRAIGDFKIPIPFTDIKSPIRNQRELGIFVLGIIVGILITLSTLMGISFLFG